MKFHIFALYLSIIIVLIAFTTYNVNEYNGNSSELQEIKSQKKNYTIEIPTTINNLIPVNNNFIIGCEYKPENFMNDYYLNNKIEDEKIYSINIDANEYNEIKIENYPKNVPFHPYSLSILYTKEKKYYLYVLNHAINYNFEGQERIDKLSLRFESKKISLSYEETIILPEEFFLRIESISAIEEDLIAFTTNSPYEMPRDSDELLNINSKLFYIWNNLLKIISPMIKIKKCFVYLYNKQNKGNEITTIDDSQSLIYSGITYDVNRNLIYAIKHTEKVMNILEIKNNEIKLINTIPILYVGNNIFYDNNEDKIYIGINGRKSDEDAILKKNKKLEEIETFSGYEILDPNNFNIKDIMVMKNDKFKWINSAVEIKGKIYMSSIYTKGILVCEK